MHPYVQTVVCCRCPGSFCFLKTDFCSHMLVFQYVNLRIRESPSGNPRIPWKFYLSVPVSSSRLNVGSISIIKLTIWVDLCFLFQRIVFYKSNKIWKSCWSWYRFLDLWLLFGHWFYVFYFHPAYTKFPNSFVFLFYFLLYKRK